ncbi:MAG TPA: TonB family protein [Bryobacteraceae bacterium]|nr:TonB family protein [Bryobacteraceae bacterium]
MAAHLDILDQPDRLSGWLFGSVVLHASVAGALIWYNFIGPGKTPTWGSLTGGGAGSVMVNPVARIPLPQNNGPQNPVANETKNMAPTPPPKAKPQPKPQAKAPDLDAIPIKSRNAKQKDRPQPANAAPNKFRQQQKDLPNQVYSHAGQALNNPMYGIQGGGGVGVGDNSPFGAQFGWYAKLVVEQAGQHWQTAGLDPRSSVAVVMFTLRRDGSVTGVKISESSGNMGTDLSAQRAILDAQPFPPLPPLFSGNQATVTLTFSLK